MKVLYFVNDSNLYGSNISLLEIICALKNQNEDYHPVLIIPNKGKIEEQLIKNKIEYYVLRYHNNIEEINKFTLIKSSIKVIWNLFIKSRLTSLTRNINPDLIVLNNSAVSIGAEIANKLNIKYYWHIREYLEEDHRLQFIQKRKTLKLINEANAVVFVSKAVREKYKNSITTPKIIEVIHNGLDVNKYMDTEKKETKDKINILISGSINGHKGHKEAIDSMKMLIDNNIENIYLYIAGNGICENEYKKYVTDLNLNDHVKFLGYVNDLKQIRKKMHIALVCSENEAYGRVTVESMLAKNFVIGSDKGGTKELIENGKTGFLYKQGDSNDLFLKIKDTIKDKKEYQQIIENAQKYAVDNFSIERYVKEIYKIYKEI